MSVASQLEKILTPVDCSQCGFPETQSLQTCFLNHGTDPTKPVFPKALPSQCLAFNTLAINPGLVGAAVGTSNLAGMMDTAPATQPQATNFTYCQGQPYDPPHDWTNLEALISNSPICDDVKPADCASGGCPSGGLPCCAGLKGVLHDCISSEGKYIAMYQCKVNPDCPPGFVLYKGKCYRDYPKPYNPVAAHAKTPADRENWADWVAPCAPNDCVQGTSSTDYGACTPQISSTGAPITCGTNYTSCAWFTGEPAQATIHASCHDTMPTIPYRAMYCQPAADPQNWKFVECQNEAGCVQPRRYWTMDPDDDTGNIEGRDPGGPTNDMKVQYCKMPWLS